MNSCKQSGKRSKVKTPFAKMCARTLLLVACCCHLISPIISIILDKQVRTVDVQAVEGRIAEFPCDINSPQHDKVHMVFWFRDDAGIPLYSFDVRGVGMSEGKHWSAPAVFGPRARFRPSPPPAALMIHDVKRHDEGVYRCRVDFRNAQTTSFRYNLTVVVPPAQPVVVDRLDGVLNGTHLGPKEEGDDLLLTCTVRGGRPPPTVRWLVNGILVDVEYEHNSGDVIENRLSWPAIGRQDFGSIFTCQAINSMLIEPKEASFVLDMNLKPLTVEIIKGETQLIADRRYSATCITVGSRPNAVITWYKGKRQMKKIKEETKDNKTVSELSFVPTTEDDGRLLTCRAENPNLSLFLETSWKIEVVYPPQVSLLLGSTLSAEDIKEGDDVYFECHVHSNPPWRKLSWMHNGVVVSHNTSARIVRSNQSLVLQRVTRYSGGRYSCSATNPEGESISDELLLRVKFAPVCRRSGPLAVGAARGERLLVPCEVDADPPARAFKWKFNNSGETLDVGADRYTSNGSVSILRYTPIADLDFGTLSCTAINDVGTQIMPCIFQMVAAGKPQPLTNCTLSNVTSGVAEVSCEAGFDGGLPQHFLLEVFSDQRRESMNTQSILNGIVFRRRRPAVEVSNCRQENIYVYVARGCQKLTTKKPKYDVFNVSNPEPMFSVPLETGVTLRLEVYAVNAKGRSPAATLSGVRLGDAEKQAAESEEASFSPWLGAVVGGLLSMIVIVALIVIRVRKGRNGGGARAPSFDKPWPPPEPTSPPLLPPKRRPMDLQGPTDTIADDRDPDIIPANYEPPSLYARTWGPDTSPKTATLPIENEVPNHSIVSHNQFTGDTPLNIQAFKEKLLDTRLPESCV